MLFCLNDDTSKIKTYVGSDGLIHFIDRNGADSVLNFNKGVEFFNDFALLSDTKTLYPIVPLKFLLVFNIFNGFKSTGSISSDYEHTVLLENYNRWNNSNTINEAGDIIWSFKNITKAGSIIGENYGGNGYAFCRYFHFNNVDSLEVINSIIGTAGVNGNISKSYKYLVLFAHTRNDIAAYPTVTWTGDGEIVYTENMPTNLGSTVQGSSKMIILKNVTNGTYTMEASNSPVLIVYGLN